MSATSRTLLLVGSLTLGSVAFLGAGGDTAMAQMVSPIQASPYVSPYAAAPYPAAPFAGDGSVVVNGEFVGRDPDPNVRASLLREYRLYDLGGQ